jgi:hypothetical protein
VASPLAWRRCLPARHATTQPVRPKRAQVPSEEVTPSRQLLERLRAPRQDHPLLPHLLHPSRALQTRPLRISHVLYSPTTTGPPFCPVSGQSRGGVSVRDAPRALVSVTPWLREQLGKDATPRAAASQSQTPRTPRFFWSSDTLELTPGSPLGSGGLELKHERSFRRLKVFAHVDSPTKTKQGRILGAMLGERSHGSRYTLTLGVLHRHRHADPAVPS